MVVKKRGFILGFDEEVDVLFRCRALVVSLMRIGYNSEKRHITDHADLLNRFFGSVIEDKKNYLYETRF